MADLTAKRHIAGIVGTAFVLLVAPGMVTSTGASAAVYYVSNSGNDSNTGTSPQYPWKTIAKVNAAHFTAGDTILFFGGQTFDGNIFLTASGATGHPIAIGTYGSPNATISAGSGSGLVWYDAGHATVENLDFQGSGGDSSQLIGVSFYADSGAWSGITVRNVAMTGFREGLYLGTAGGSYQDISIAGVTAYDNGDSGIFVDNSPSWPTPEVSDLTIRDTSTYGNSRWGIQIEGVERGIVENSVAYGNGDIGMWSWAADHIVFQKDIAYGNGGKDGGFDLDVGTTNSTIQYSYAYENGGSGFQVCNYAYNPVTANNTIRFNIAENNYGSADGLELDGDGSVILGLYYYNNTIYSNTAGGDYHMAEYTPADNIIVANNIVYVGKNSTSASSWASAPLMLDYDDWFGELGVFWFDDTSYGSYQSFREATGKERNGRSVVPGFIGPPGTKHAAAYRLNPNSPLRGAGVDLWHAYHIDPGPRDYFGNLLPRHGTFSIGADQGTSGGN